MTPCKRYEWCLGHSEDTIPESADIHVAETANFDFPTKNPLFSADLSLMASGDDLRLVLDIEAEGVQIPIQSPEKVTEGLRALADLIENYCQVLAPAT